MSECFFYAGGFLDARDKVQLSGPGGRANKQIVVDTEMIDQIDCDQSVHDASRAHLGHLTRSDNSVLHKRGETLQSGAPEIVCSEVFGEVAVANLRQARIWQISVAGLSR